MSMSKLEFIAKVRYLGWICYQLGADLPLHDVDKEYNISNERLESLKEGSAFLLENPNFTGEENHNFWMKIKEMQGYTYGEVIDVENKTHPSIIPYEDLSEVEKRKDDMDILMTKLAAKLFNEMNK